MLLDDHIHLVCVKVYLSIIQVHAAVDGQVNLSLLGRTFLLEHDLIVQRVRVEDLRVLIKGLSFGIDMRKLPC